MAAACAALLSAVMLPVVALGVLGSACAVFWLDHAGRLLPREVVASVIAGTLTAFCMYLGEACCAA
jgi:hypothetical protein